MQSIKFHQAENRKNLIRRLNNLINMNQKLLAGLERELPIIKSTCGFTPDSKEVTTFKDIRNAYKEGLFSNGQELSGQLELYITKYLK